MNMYEKFLFIDGKNENLSDEKIETVSNCFQQLEFFYSRPIRYYHNLFHIEDCLEQTKHIKEDVDMLSIKYAIWFHDAVYQPFNKNNEFLSADLFRIWAPLLGVPNDKLEIIVKMIAATKDHLQDYCGNAIGISNDYFLDIDLSILGREQNVFDEYENNIRKEYSEITDIQFQMGRKRVLEKFLRVDRIYRTDVFANLYETKARQNISNSLDKLNKEISKHFENSPIAKSFL